MQDTNYVILIGRLTRDAELKYTNSGLAVCNFDIAMSKRVKQGDKWEEATIFVNRLALFGKRAEGLNQYLTKGQQIAVEGSLDLDQWMDQETQKNRQKLKVVVNNIQLLGGRNGGQGGGQSGTPFTPQNPPPDNYDADFEDDIPF